MKEHIILALVILCILCSTFENSGIAIAAEQKVVKIGCAVSTGYYQYDEEGNISGYGKEYDKIMEQFTNWKIEYVEGTWDDLTKKLADGEIDLLGFWIKTEEREKMFDFANIATGKSTSCLITLQNN